MFTAILVAFVVVGAILTTRVPGNAVGPVLLFSGALLATTIAIGTFSVVGAATGSMPTDVVAVTSLINDLGLHPAHHRRAHRRPAHLPGRAPALAALALDRRPGHRGRRGVDPGPGLRPRPHSGRPRCPTRSRGPSGSRSLEALDAFASWSSIIGFGAAILAVILRYRRGDVVQRQQLKWPAVSIVIALVFPLAFVRPGRASARTWRS